MEDIEPLEPALWFGALRNLAHRLDSAQPGEVESALRHAYHLLQLTPRPLRATIRPDLAEVEFGQLLESRAFDAAADALVGHPMTCTVATPGAELFVAQVSLPGQSEPTAVQSDRYATALLSAWTQCLIELEERALRLQTGDLRPIPRKARSAQRLRQIVP